MRCAASNIHASSSQCRKNERLCVIWSMVRKSGTGFSSRQTRKRVCVEIMPKQEDESMLRFHAIVTCSGTIEGTPLFQRRSDVLSCGGIALPLNGRSFDLDSPSVTTR